MLCFLFQLTLVQFRCKEPLAYIASLPAQFIAFYQDMSQSKPQSHNLDTEQSSNLNTAALTPSKENVCHCSANLQCLRHQCRGS